VEDRLRCAETTGLVAMPCDTFERNQLRCQLVMIDGDLLTFTQQLTLRGRHAIAEPRALRHQLLHVAGRIVRTGRRTVLQLQADWPYTPSCSPRSDDSERSPPRPDDPAEALLGNMTAHPDVTDVATTPAHQPTPQRHSAVTR
jgi:hypothetical protein